MPTNNTIAHSAKGTTWEKAKHKYLYRVKNKGKYYYFYTLAAYKAFLKKNPSAKGEKIGDATGVDEAKSGAAESFADKVKNFLTKAVDSITIDDKVKAWVEQRKEERIKKQTEKRREQLREQRSWEHHLEKAEKYRDIPTSHDPKNHKYLAKVKLPSGKYRYFYDQKEYDAYLRAKEMFKNDENQIENYLEIQKYQDDEPDFMKDVAEIKDYKHTDEDDQAAINPNYPYSNPNWTYKDANEAYGYTVNCMYCTTAYELRQRGYDVEAAASEEGHSNREAMNWFEEPDFKGGSDWSTGELISAMNDYYPEGSRGNFTVQWSGTRSGHSMVWEKKDGEIIIRDTQANQVWDIGELDMYSESPVCYRTDNLKLKEGVLECVETKKKGGKAA